MLVLSSAVEAELVDYLWNKLNSIYLETKSQTVITYGQNWVLLDFSASFS